MTNDVAKLVRAICPDFPEDKQVKTSHDQFTWFKIIRATNTLVIPPINYVQGNMLMLDKTVEAISAYAHSELDAPEFDWDHLNLYEASNPEEILRTIEIVRNVAQGRDVGVDIETRRIEWEDNKLLSIGFATDESTCYALYNIPIIGANGEGHDTQIWEALEGLLTDENIQFVWHNGKFDCTRLKYLCNLDARVDDDTMLYHYCAINEKRGTHGLKDLGQLYLQAPAWDDALEKIKRDFCKKNKMRIGDFMYDDIPTSVLVPYMQRDCIATLRLKRVFMRLGRPEASFIYGKLIEASNAFIRVELNGIRLDLDYLEDLEFELEKELEEATKRLDEVASSIWDPLEYSGDTGARVKLTDKFNIKSPKQLKWMLQQVLGYPVPSTDAATIDALIDEVESGVITNPQAKDFLQAIASVRKNSKYMDTYVQGMRDCVCRDARIRGTFNLHGTETGRLSSSNPRHVGA